MCGGRCDTARRPLRDGDEREVGVREALLPILGSAAAEDGRTRATVPSGESGVRRHEEDAGELSGVHDAGEVLGRFRRFTPRRRSLARGFRSIRRRNVLDLVPGDAAYLRLALHEDG
jgi:hypothetical protein